MNLLRSAGLGDTLVPFLEARIMVQQKKWSQAIRRLEPARALLRSNPPLAGQVDLMLFECYGRVGSDEKRLDALRRFAEGDQSPESARIELRRPLPARGSSIKH